MIKLFESNISPQTNLNTNGLGVLPDAISCIVREELNGGFELEMEYPVTGLHFSDITMRRCIVCKPNPYETEQIFRIYQISYPINGIVTINAQHISYDMSGIPVRRFGRCYTIQNAVMNIIAKAPENNPFTISVSGSGFKTEDDMGEEIYLENSVPNSMRALLGGNNDNVLSIFCEKDGVGEIYFNNYECIIKDSRAVNQNGIPRIAYGKNLIDFKQEKNIAEVYTGIYPFYFSGTSYYNDPDGHTDKYVELTENTRRTETTTQTDSEYYDDHCVYVEGTFGYKKILPVDLTSYFDEKPSEHELLKKAKKYIEAKHVGRPELSLEVSFVELSQASESERYPLLEEVVIGDRVLVEFPAIGVSEEGKCNKTEYDVITNKYISITIGDAAGGLDDILTDQVSTVKSMASNNSLRSAILKATQKITGNLGGYVVLHDSDEDGYPDEILIMDTDDITTATKVWRWNNEGLGYSSNGYNGTFGLAMTSDGEIVADYITSGTINTDMIRASGAKSIIHSGSTYPDEEGLVEGDVWRVGNTDVEYDDTVYTANTTYQWNGDEWEEITDISALSTAAAISVMYDTITLAVEDDYYHKVSDITITPEGITISGDKYIILQAGSYIGGSASNMSITRDGNLRVSGNIYCDNIYADNLQFGANGSGGYLNNSTNGVLQCKTLTATDKVHTKDLEVTNDATIKNLEITGELTLPFALVGVFG